MVKKKDPLELIFVVTGHAKQDEAGKESVYIVKLKAKKEGNVSAALRIKSMDECIFDELPILSERQVKLVDEQTTLEPETTE